MSRTNINPTAGVLRHEAYFPSQEALVYGGRTWSYAELVAEVRIFAGALAAAGLRPGDRVAYLGLNSVTFIETMLASWWVGAVFEPLNFRLAPSEVQGLLEMSTPTVLVVEPTHLDVVDVVQNRGGLGSGTCVLVVDNDAEVPAPPEFSPRYSRLSEFLRGGASTVPQVASAGDEGLAILMFTSGTTGRPKGVQLTFGNLWWNQLNVDSLVDTRRGDTNLAVAPLFHIGGLNALTIRNLVRGGRTVIRRAFDPREALRDIERHSVAQAFLVPAMLSAMQATEEFAHRDLSSLRSLICAGAPVPPILLRQYEVKGVAVQQAWGLTETSPFATYLPAELTHAKAGSCGMPMPHTQVRIVDPETGKEAAAGEPGEMWVKGPNVTPGYWQDPVSTAAAFTDGWFRTGDIGYQDPDGFFYIVDRLKDMIITGGENVYPAEVERVLMEYPGVLDVAVVGVDDPDWGESVTAVMCLRDHQEPTIDEVRTFAGLHLARYKIPKNLVLTTAVPRNGSGKLDKVSVRALAAASLQDGASRR
ncbi:long-chain fatty acid--CoA ligase [Arthrobacter ginkgonis]|uniref:Long-chain fatty acid--CoA ligase n=1 Tax=Arthrobacter ginkgonis TaxID=1630594 RepID=A0ABP7CWP9_9MICC